MLEIFTYFLIPLLNIRSTITNSTYGFFKPIFCLCLKKLIKRNENLYSLRLSWENNESWMDMSCVWGHSNSTLHSSGTFLTSEIRRFLKTYGLWTVKWIRKKVSFIAWFLTSKSNKNQSFKKAKNVLMKLCVNDHKLFEWPYLQVLFLYNVTSFLHCNKLMRATCWGRVERY